MHGSPCQDFSIAGKQAGGDKGSGTRSSLLYETLRIVKDIMPKNIIWENVKNLTSKKHIHNLHTYIHTLETYGYTNYYKVLNAKNYGIPQNRERLFVISTLDKKPFEFPPSIPLDKKLSDLKEEHVDEKYFLSQKLINCFMSNGTGKYPRRERFLSNINRKNQEIANAITTIPGNRPTDNFIKVKVATKKGYQEAYEGDSINIAFPDSKTRRGRVGKQIANTITCNNNQVIVESLKYKLCDKLIETGNIKENDVIKHSYSSDRLKRLTQAVEKENNISPTLTTRSDCLGIAVIDGEVLRIRKFTPRECWRLMGFEDSDFDKAEKVNSNAQLFKQAGNSIVVNVLMAIFKNLLED